MDEVGSWMGRKLSELSRDELLDVIKYLASRLGEHTTPDAIQANALGKVEMLRRRL